MKQNFLIISISIFFFLSCNKNQNYDKIVLKVGQLEVTQYEYNRNKRGLDNNDSTLKNWGKEFIDRCIIIADAYEKGYDTIQKIDAELHNISEFMMLQRYGYLWKYNTAPIVDEFKIPTPEKLEKRKNLYYFDYILIKDKSEFLRMVKNDTIIQDVDEYNSLKAKCQSNDFLETGYFSLQWPFISFWDDKDYLLDLQQGEITKILSSNESFIILYLDHIEQINLRENEADILLTELQLGIEGELEKKTSKERLALAKPQLIENNVYMVADFLEQGYQLKDYNENVAFLEYTLNDTLKYIYLNDLVDYISNVPMQKEVSNREDIEGLSYQLVHNSYRNYEAISLGLYEIDTFLLAQRNFKNGLVYRDYLSNEILNTIDIDSSKLKEKYEAELKELMNSLIIELDLYIFNNLLAAKENREQLISLVQGKSDQLNGFMAAKQIVAQEGFIFDCNYPENYPEIFARTCLKQEINSFSDPIEMNRQFIICHKRSNKKQPEINEQELRGKIESELAQELFNIELEKLLVDLAQKYPVEINETGIVY